MKLTLTFALALAVPTAAIAEKVRYFPPEEAQAAYTCDWGGDGKSNAMVNVSDFEADWFSRHLRAAQEPSLYTAPKAKYAAGRETIRFTWLRSFHPPVVVRVEVNGRGGHLIAKELSGAGGYDPGEVEHRIERKLKASELLALHEAVSRTRLLGTDLRDCRIGVDGAEWIIEYVDRTGYHVLKHWSPDDGPIREVGLFLVGLTGWQIKVIY